MEASLAIYLDVNISSFDFFLFTEARFAYQTIIRRLQNLILDTFTYLLS